VSSASASFRIRPREPSAALGLRKPWPDVSIAKSSARALKQASGSLNITPFAAVQFAEIWQQRFTEASMTAGGAPGVLGLTFPSVTATSLPTFLGMQFDTKIAMFGGSLFAPYLRVSWVHEFNPDRSIGAYFNSVPGASFVVDGPRVGSDSAKIDLGMNLAFNRQLALFGNFNSEASSRSHSYAGQGGLRFVW
jgi:outer membrane autotransporter protein